MAYDFSGKIALVTGAGRGIGREIVRSLVKCNANVIALDVDQENLNSLKKEIPGVDIISVDLSDWNGTRKAVESLGVIDLLVNNAGIGIQETFEEITEDSFDRLFAVNVKPVINVSQVVTRGLKERGRPGAIVNIASASATVYIPSIAAYSASKATVQKITKTMAVELADYGIRVNAINPTYLATEMSKQILQGEYEKQMLHAVPLRKFAETTDVASSVLFLLSDEAKMITGTCLHVDGGHRVA